MKYIPANTAFKCIGCFTLQPVKEGTPPTVPETTIYISVDGVDFTAMEDTFQGAQVFKDGPFNTWLKCNHNVYCSESTGYEVDPVTITVTPSTQNAGGRLIAETVQGQKVVASSLGADLSVTVDRGTPLWIKFVPTIEHDSTHGYPYTQRFNGWSDGVDENTRLLIPTADSTTITANIDKI